MLIYICLLLLCVVTFVLAVRLDRVSKFVGYKKAKKGDNNVKSEDDKTSND